MAEEWGSYQPHTYVLDVVAVVERMLQVSTNTGDVERLVTLVVEAEQDGDGLAQHELFECHTDNKDQHDYSCRTARCASTTTYFVE